MAVDETRRHDLHRAARRTLGEGPGDTLMEMLSSLAMDRLERRFDRLEARFEGMEARFEGMEVRLEGMEARFDAKLERGLREQADRFIRWMFGGLTIALTLGMAASTAIASVI